uniref:Uncharacterized protein n=1 Tax=Arion vulgaris TaxID=1028688 RepID=A0A0B6YSU4_9EUPU
MDDQMAQADSQITIMSAEITIGCSYGLAYSITVSISANVVMVDAQTTEKDK